MRTMIVWCPDWPVRAVLQANLETTIGSGTPIALFDRSAVFACSATARSQGVRRGQRMRDAQSRCPDLVTLEYDPALDVRAFDPVLAAVEEISPGVQTLRPGTCAVRIQGPSRYYGGEPQAAAVVAERLVGLGVADCRFGVADGPFAAEQAARTALVQDSVVIEPGGSAQFLHPLSVDVLDRPDLVSLLRRLGLRTLGAFAGLSQRDVLTRFGEQGAFAHRLAQGADDRPFVARRPPREQERSVDFEPPLEQVEPIAFSMRRTAEEFVAALADQQLVCTSVWIEVHTDAGEIYERQWLHPRWFDASDLIDRVRWQLGSGSQGGSGVSAPVSQVRLIPDTVAPITDHADGLWGSGPDEQIDRAMSKVQSVLGREAVVSAVLGGGRSPAQRQTLVPWGDPLTPDRSSKAPWPGSLPPPAPATVFDRPGPALVVGAGGQAVGVTARGALTAEPVRFCAAGTKELRPVQAWAGPWPVDERWWDETAARRAARFQVVGVDGSAWLLTVENGRWWTEARYD